MGEHIRNIIANYKKLEEKMISEFDIVEKHGTTKGSSREGMWADFFKQIVPKKFTVDNNVFIIDSNGEISKEVDIVIYDNNYTPYIFNYVSIKYIPIEAVIAVIECKSKSIDGKKIVEWCEKIDKLKTSDKGIARMATSIATGESKCQKGTKPIKIFVSPNLKDTNEKEMKSFDITIIRREEKNETKNRFKVNYNFENNELVEILKQLNCLDEKDISKENKDKLCDKKDKSKLCDKGQPFTTKDFDITDSTLLSFLLTFNQILMLVNNPILFPHKAYVDMFNKHIEEEGNTN